MNPVAGREAFVGVGPVWLFYLLAAAASTVFVLGLVSHLKVWRSGLAAGGSWSWRGFLVDGLLMARLWRRDPLAACLHASLLGGFLLLFAATGLWALHEYTYPFLRGRPYLVFSTAADLAGLLLVVGVAGLALRRLVLGRRRLPGGWEDWGALALLMVVGVSGFLAEAARLQATRPAWAWASPVGAALAAMLPGRLAGAPGLWWWVHAISALGLIAWLPWMKLLHSLAAPLNLATAAGRGEPTAEAREESGRPLLAGQLLSLDACARCNRCETRCPSFAAGEGLSPRQLTQQVRRTMLGRHGLWAKPPDDSAGGSLSASDPFLCTTCGACQEVCPAGVSPLEIIRAERTLLVEQGQGVPGDVIEALESLAKYANPWATPRKKRGAWSKGLDLVDLAKGGQAKWLLFAGCTTSLDQRAQAMAQAMARLLAAAGVSAGVLGRKEPCCGDIARRLGEAGLFEMHLEDTAAVLAGVDCQGVVTMSPHCAYTMNQDYPRLAPALELEDDWSHQPLHYSQLLDRLLADGRLELTGTLAGRATFHDPCYLGRHRGIFDPPRRVIRATGLTLVEMADHGQDSLCCGAGGGRMWHAEVQDADTHISALRVAQAQAAQVRYLVTACPLCLIMLTDAVKTAGLEAEIQVIDLAELALRAAGGPEPA